MADERQAAVITGGAGNLGKVVVERFLESGYRVVVPWLDEEKWGALQEELPQDARECCRGVEADLTDERAVRALMDGTAEREGGPDAVLNLVGGFAFGEKVWEMDPGTWERMMDLNLRTAFLCCRYALPHMRERGGGRIVNVSSKASLDIQPGAAAYAVSKAAVTTFTRALREELKGTGITANAIMPSIIRTPVTERLMPESDHEKWVAPEDIADVLLRLCSDELEPVSGTVVRLFGEL